MLSMKKGILLSLLAFVLVGAIAFAIWYINEDGKMRVGNKDAFIPYNSALVVSVNAEARLTPEVEKAFAGDFQEFRKRLLYKVTDTLRGRGNVAAYPYVWAMRVEGKSDIAFLYVMDNKDVLSRGEIADFLNQAFAGGEGKSRKYDRYRIYTLKQGKEVVYFAICGGIILVSDSDLYIEDGLKQFDLETEEKEIKPRYQNLNKYFSVGAGINIFLNTSLFTDVLPLYLQVKEIFPHVDITRFFKWGALDGEFSDQGVCLNGFLHYGGLDKSYIQTLEKQQPRETTVDGILPAHLISLGMLNLSNTATYFSALEAYRYNTGRKEFIFNRKRQFAQMFGKTTEQELTDLLQGEFAVINFSYNESTREKDGLTVICLKSGSLCKLLLDKMLKNYARFDNKEVGAYQKEYGIDREKTFVYYRFPAEDFSAVYWGDLFEGLKNRYVLVEDNYLIFASSENAVKAFVKDYVHGNFIRDTEWYKNLQTKLSRKYNLSYFARTGDVLPLFKNLSKGEWQKFISGKTTPLAAFPSFALQWSNEGDMLYNTLFLSSSKLQEEVRPHVLWQTKLDARVSMKPVPVNNHVNGERELFVQDDQNNIYLINDGGRILWKLALGEKINSEVYQVDLFKNGKLQYLFSTPSKIYLIDRNGEAAGNFPVTLRTACEQGITVYDYDNNRDYRIFVPCLDREVYLYGLDGKVVQGWNPRKADKSIVTKVQHFRVENKDYLVFADQYRFYILDRKGKERVRVSTVFDLKEQTDIYLTKKGGQAVLLFAGRGGKVHIVDFAGQVQTFTVPGLSDDSRLNVADVNGDGVDECVFTDSNHVKICQLDGKLLSDKQLESESLGYPYVYRFSASDIRIGLNDARQNQLLLLSAGGDLSKGFPIAGDSPFSIVFFGNEGFYLFAGSDNGSVIKYRVMR